MKCWPILLCPPDLAAMCAVLEPPATSPVTHGVSGLCEVAVVPSRGNCVHDKETRGHLVGKQAFRI